MDEHPQTIALILSHLPPAIGAEIISGLPEDRQMAVVRRIANMGQTNPAVIAEVEAGLEKRMHSVMSQSYERAGGVPSVAEILNVTDRGTERALLESLAQEDPELVESIRRLMFVFDDVARLSDKDIQNVLKNVESAQWAMALKGASAELREKIMGNMSKRAGDLLTEEMEYLGAVRLSTVEQAQQQIVDIVRAPRSNRRLIVSECCCSYRCTRRAGRKTRRVGCRARSGAESSTSFANRNGGCTF
jgi:flagellar motor switch protein FliG